MSWFNDYTLRTVILGTSLLGLFSGALGCIAVLRRQSLVGDTLAHASLPGICLAYLLFRSREAIPLMLGAAFAGLIAMGIVSITQRATKTDSNSAMGTVLTVFFGAGAVILGKSSNFSPLIPFLRRASACPFAAPMSFSLGSLWVRLLLG